MTPILGSHLAAGAEDRGERVERGRDEGVEGPFAALVAGEDPGVDQNLEVMGDGRLGQAERFGEVTDAGLAVFKHGDHGDQLQPGGVGQGLEQPGELGSLAGGNRLAQQRCAARIGQREGWPGPSDSGGGHLTSMHWILTGVYLCGMLIDR